ncbi:MAG: hypothetical protein AAFY76_22080, partial [Cyanobacteria bacterium J06649_11]
MSIIDPRILRHLEGKPAEFIKAFKERKYDSEEEFILRVCGEKYSKNHYIKLKSRTIQILQSLAAMSSSRGGGVLKKKYDSCARKFIVAQKFLNIGEIKEGMIVMKQVHDEAVEYNFLHLACETASLLYLNSLHYHGDEKQAAIYAFQGKEYMREYLAEKNAFYSFYQAYCHRDHSDRALELNRALAKIQEYKGKGLKYAFYKHRLRILYHFHQADHQLVIQECEQALDFFKDKKGVYSSTYLFFYLTAGVAHLSIARYEDAEERLTQAMTYAPKNSQNDAILQFYRLLTAMHQGAFEQAYALFLKNKDCADQQIQNLFRLVEAYF